MVAIELKLLSRLKIFPGTGPCRDKLSVTKLEDLLSHSEARLEKNTFPQVSNV